MSLTFVKVGFYDKETGFLAFEVQMPYQKYQQPPILVRFTKPSFTNVLWIGSGSLCLPRLKELIFVILFVIQPK